MAPRIPIARLLRASIPQRALCAAPRRTLASISTSAHTPMLAPKPAAPTPASFTTTTTRRHASSSGRSPADEVAEELQVVYGEAKDEFEIAVESTEANATYAGEDRAAAQEELERLRSVWKEALEGEAEVVEELKRRPIGQRIRELENAVEELERWANEHD